MVAGRALAVVVVTLFAFSVVAAFFTTDRARRVCYFDLIGFGF